LIQTQRSVESEPKRGQIKRPGRKIETADVWCGDGLVLWRTFDHASPETSQMLQD
jgi:hypothetical protein